ncbi:lipoprotein [Caballeronia hypogeia]|uniref:Lipoprotein n=1 Tax=Caballeronia hypogeia TaxID=1777140 RepID=A0A158B2B0_9BURK|nr:lipoprotein [Caballeronia hypogeia]
MQDMKHGRWLAGAAAAIATSITLSGCGAWQATKDGTVDAYNWAFVTQVKAMNIDLDARAAANETTSGQSLSTVVRLYQLKDSKTFAQLEYVQLQNHDLELLKADLVATKDVVMRPGSSASVSEPMDKDAEYVGVVAFFRSPSSDGVWKLLIPKKQWKDTDPVKVHVQGNLLAYDGANPKPVKRDAPQQSTPAQSGTSASATASAKEASSASKVQSTIKLINPDAALGNASDSPQALGAALPTPTPTPTPAQPSMPTTVPSAPSAGSVSSSVSKASAAGKAVAPNPAPKLSAAADALSKAKATASGLAKSAAGLLSQ